MGFDLYCDATGPRGDLTFRFSRHAMLVLATTLEELDVAHRGEAPAMPVFPPRGFSSEQRAHDVFGELDRGAAARPPPVAGERLAAVAYFAAREAVVTAPGIRDGKLPAFKWKDNNGWLVLPDECRLTCAALQRPWGKVRVIDELAVFLADAEIDTQPACRDLLARWATFSDQCSTRGGYRVA